MACPATDGWRITGSHYLRLEQIGETSITQIPHVGRFCCRDGPVRASVALMSRLHVWCSSFGHRISRKEVATLNCERAKASSPRVPLHPAAPHTLPTTSGMAKEGFGYSTHLGVAATRGQHSRYPPGAELCAGSWCTLTEAGNKQDTPATLVTPGGQSEAPPEDTCG